MKNTKLFIKNNKSIFLILIALVLLINIVHADENSLESGIDKNENSVVSTCSDGLLKVINGFLNKLGYQQDLCKENSNIKITSAGEGKILLPSICLTQETCDCEPGYECSESSIEIEPIITPFNELPDDLSGSTCSDDTNTDVTNPVSITGNAIYKEENGNFKVNVVENQYLKTDANELAKKIARLAECFKQDIENRWFSDKVVLNYDIKYVPAKDFVRAYADSTNLIYIETDLNGVLTGELKHEISHAIINKRFGIRLTNRGYVSNFPPWADEGIATHYTDKIRADNHKALMRNYVNDEKAPLSLDLLLSRTDSFEASDEFNYALAFYLTEYLLRIGGKEKLIEFAKAGIGKNIDWDTNINNFYGIDNRYGKSNNLHNIKELEEAFKRWIRGDIDYKIKIRIHRDETATFNINMLNEQSSYASLSIEEIFTSTYASLSFEDIAKGVAAPKYLTFDPQPLEIEPKLKASLKLTVNKANKFGEFFLSVKTDYKDKRGEYWDALGTTFGQMKITVEEMPLCEAKCPATIEVLPLPLIDIENRELVIPKEKIGQVINPEIPIKNDGVKTVQVKDIVIDQLRADGSIIKKTSFEELHLTGLIQLTSGKVATITVPGVKADIGDKIRISYTLIRDGIPDKKRITLTIAEKKCPDKTKPKVPISLPSLR